jgi:hypothetical protein
MHTEESPKFNEWIKIDWHGSRHPHGWQYHHVLLQTSPEVNYTLLVLVVHPKFEAAFLAINIVEWRCLLLKDLKYYAILNC